jgi:hypothetical protein
LPPNPSYNFKNSQHDVASDEAKDFFLGDSLDMSDWLTIEPLAKCISMIFRVISSTEAGEATVFVSTEFILY